MKTLILFRHAKSDWSSGETNDHDRPLAPRGQKAAKTMGRFLKQSGQAPDSIVTSSALRARNTVDLAVKAGEWDCKTRITDRLYNCSPVDMLKEIRAEADTTQVLLIAGHEPTCSETIARLTGDAKLGFSTGAMARLDFPIERWRDADFGRAELVWLVPPKLVKKLLKE
ncbi:MAG: histidine phosphatase family protein [Acidobacteriota bacterium]